MDLTKIDMERLVADLMPVIEAGIKDLVVGTKEDIEEYAQSISRDLLASQILGNGQLEEQLIDQLILLAEIQQIRVRNNSWGLLTTIVSTIFKAAVAGIMAAF